MRGALRERTCLSGTPNNGDQALAYIPVHVEVLGVLLEGVRLHILGLSPFGAKCHIGGAQCTLHLINTILQPVSQSVAYTVVRLQETLCSSAYHLIICAHGSAILPANQPKLAESTLTSSLAM